MMNVMEHKKHKTSILFTKKLMEHNNNKKKPYNVHFVHILFKYRIDDMSPAQGRACCPPEKLLP